MKDSTDPLIKKLTTDLKPVKRLSSNRLFVLFLVSLGTLAFAWLQLKGLALSLFFGWLLLILWPLLMGAQTFSWEGLWNEFGLFCFVASLGVALASSTVLAFLVRKGTFVALGWGSLLIFGMAGAIGGLLIDCSCAADHPLHLLTSHFPAIPLSSAPGLVSPGAVYWTQNSSLVAVFL